VKVADYKGAEVYTLEGRRIGGIKEINSKYFTAFERGLLTDEEFRIPISSVSAVEKHDNTTIVRLSLKEEQLKHGYEFAKGRPNSEFASGAAEWEPKVPLEKPLIHYESYQAEAGSTAGRPPAISEYLCNMCDEKFANSTELQEHRVVQHKAPTGI
jgi:sporulation protein YlmC with PRC-barrel domain